MGEELRKLHKQESDALSQAYEKLAAADEKDDQGVSRFTVGKEIKDLQKKLEGRKQLRALPDSVEAARGDVVRCLRENDRRPLDCWEEVEKFKAEVKKLEKSWVDRVTS